MSVAVAMLALACAERATPAVEPTGPTVFVETPVEEQPPEPKPVEGAVEAKIGFQQGDRCTIDSIGFEFPLVAADGSEIVIMARHDTDYHDGTDKLLQGLWHAKIGESGVFQGYVRDRAIQLVDWLGVDASTCDEVERLAASAVAEANAYLASKQWLPMKEIEDFYYVTGSGPPRQDQHYSCVPGTQLDLCASEAGFGGTLHNSDWEREYQTWLYVSLRACVAVAVQYEQEDGPAKRTAIEVFDIADIVAALPPEDDAVECGPG
ncbi:MAG TPA: hypothetical protein VK034_03470 [Enhygromyxa sp.]|nr:hypothetical protein [Enhygromyxa sp.]